jgi:uncharacterized small protein (DUF1192 family)
LEVEEARALYMKARADRAESQFEREAAGWIASGELNKRVAALRNEIGKRIRASRLEPLLKAELLDDLAGLEKLKRP